MRFLPAIAVVISAASLGVTALALLAVRRARAQIAAARLEVDAWRDRTSLAEAQVDLALRRLEELRQLRVDDVQRMRDDVRELRDNYERIRTRATATIDGPLASRTVQ